MYHPMPLRRLVSAILLCATIGPAASAQAVIFPQAVQPGKATLSTDGETYTLENRLIEAKFIREGSSLKFGGCPEMNLAAGTELFRITLGNGETLTPSDMTMSDISTIALTGQKDAVKGSDRFGGQAIEANFTRGPLTVAWRAVLRDGSHYLRTELKLNTSDDIAMKGVTPMIYNVETIEGVASPKVVGNTRGAILANDRIFAGVESPMGINSIVTSNTITDNFSHDSWTAENFKMIEADAIPKEILELGFSASEITGSSGYLYFCEAGENNITFTYTSGTHRLNITGVDICTPDGSKVVASDYHIGHTGESNTNNVYTLNVDKAGAYLVRFFMEVRTETITSSGEISYSKRVVIPEIIYGEAPEATVSVSAPASRSLSKSTLSPGERAQDHWYWSQWSQVASGNVPQAITDLNFDYPSVYAISREISFTEAARLTVNFVWTGGMWGLWTPGVDIVDEYGSVIAYDYHHNKPAGGSENNTYVLNVPRSGNYTIRFYGINDYNDPLRSCNGNINLSYDKSYPVYLPVTDNSRTTMEGFWSRNTTLQTGKTWTISSVVGLIAPNQARRSVLAYSERERAVPWRPFPLYNSWYELNIDRNNALPPSYTGNMTIGQCVDVVNQWHTNLYDAHGANISAFVWDDGWDSYGTWTFNPNFPNGFKEVDAVATDMNTGIGAWLGPVGGYGASGENRRKYWTDKGQVMRFSNPEYYNVFLQAVTNLCTDYDFRFFKLDGISAQFSSVGPDAGTEGEENAEGIIEIEQHVREIKPDLFLNTSVGTWASPFWFRYTDAVWRQESDFGTIGNQGSDRERWITYRDRLVYQNFVKNSPLCPINTLMTHGVILTTRGSVATDMDYDGILREIYCAFACGSGMVELYADYALLNSINGGALWADLAECIKWQQAKAEVLPDIHWVGGNPWDGTKANVYGWASWNGKECTLALRNPAASDATYTFTLREALDIPDYVSSRMQLKPSFSKISALPGLDTTAPINIDTPLTVRLAASSVYVFDGIDPTGSSIDNIDNDTSVPVVTGTYDLLGRRVADNPTHPGIYIINGTKTIVR